MHDNIVIQEEYIIPQKSIETSYPVISGMSDSNLEKKINLLIMNTMVLRILENNYVDQDEVYFSIIYTYYNTIVMKDLLNVEQFVEEYWSGAASGNHFRRNIFIDLKSGKTYDLNNLFKNPKKGIERLSKIITGKIQEDEEDYSIEQFDPERIKNFSLTEDGINIYFEEGDIIESTYGMPEFFVPFDILIDLIDEQGDFWLSFRK